MGGPQDPPSIGTELSEVLSRCSAHISRTNAQVLDFSMLAGLEAKADELVSICDVLSVLISQLQTMLM